MNTYVDEKIINPNNTLHSLKYANISPNSNVFFNPKYIHE